MNLCTKCGFEVGGVLCKCPPEDRIDWDLAFDGEIHVLVAGEDFTCSVSRMLDLIDSNAKDRALEARAGRCRNPETKEPTDNIAVRVVDGIC